MLKKCLVSCSTQTFSLSQYYRSNHDDEKSVDSTCMQMESTVCLSLCNLQLFFHNIIRHLPDETKILMSALDLGGELSITTTHNKDVGRSIDSGRAKGDEKNDNKRRSTRKRLRSMEVVLEY